MVDANKAKFGQNKEIADLLTSEEFKGKGMVEASPLDRVWGVGLTENDPLADDEKYWLGQNLLGKALDEVSISFRKNEFVSILGQSGSGKSTLLNIIGGLDHYTSGDLVINGVSTKNYKDSNWDAYRNYKIGFIFQNYNLITHQSVLSNVELALTLSGVSKFEKKKRAVEALKQVGLENHINKKPSQLSGGQMQRVAIARALVNNPEIILADEPTRSIRF